jgi:EAL domain-containing protein (putative c-di-GMP-specific phosphodiesterase class I)
VKRDVTVERATQTRETTRARERTQIAQALAALAPRATAEETADAICRRIVQLPDTDVAVIITFDPDGAATPLGAAETDGAMLGRSRLGGGRARNLQVRAAAGPWIESWDEAVGHSFGDPFRLLGVCDLAYAPIWIDREVVGLLEVGSSDPESRARLVERLPAIVEFASIAGAVLGPVIVSRATLGRSRSRIQTMLASGAFHPVFQPIVDLVSGDVAGYEALTRFDSGQRPDLCFADAWSVGLGPELELATLGAAVGAAKVLPAGAWLDLNVSPRDLAAPESLRAILWAADRPLVLEITEHEMIEDYDALHTAIMDLGLDVRVAVDDAGAGIANFGHIVELRPDFVKLDISLVRHVNANLGRQAMVVGMRHFARTAGCRLIAEGVETDEEAQTLRALGVEFGQGYLLGRPEPASTWAGKTRLGPGKPDR